MQQTKHETKEGQNLKAEYIHLLMQQIVDHFWIIFF